MKLRLLGLVLLGLLAYALFLLSSLPAAHAWSLLSRHMPAQAYGLSGTLWNGQAAVVLQEQRRLEAVQWELRPASLLTGRLGADIQARLPDGRLRSEVVATPTGRVTARQLRLDMPAAELVQWAGLAGRLPVQLAGRFDVLMRELVLVDQRLEQADGLVNWHAANVRFGSLALPLGDLALRLEPTADGATGGTLVNQGGAVDLSGTLQIGQDGRFVLDLTTRARDAVDQDVVPALQLLGIPPDGSPVRGRLSGNLDGSGLRLEPLEG